MEPIQFPPIKKGETVTISYPNGVTDVATVEDLTFSDDLTETTLHLRPRHIEYEPTES